jgi:hypothetical protein
MRTDGTRLPIEINGDLGPSPFCGQLSGKPNARPSLDAILFARQRRGSLGRSVRRGE